MTSAGGSPTAGGETVTRKAPRWMWIALIASLAVNVAVIGVFAGVALGFFWILGATVFYQFFTRYVMNDSAAWTEEISRYLLIATVFMGIAAATRRTRHIHVDFVYRLIPAGAGRALSTLIDLLRIAFFAVAVALTIQMMLRMTYMKMTIIDLPMNIVFAVCAAGFAAAAFRSVQVAIENWKRGYSVLEKPEAFIDEVIK